MAEIPHNFPFYFNDLFDKLHNTFPTLSRLDKLKKWHGIDEDYQYSIQSLDFELENEHLKLTTPQARLVKEVVILYDKYRKELFPLEGGNIQDELRYRRDRLRTLRYQLANLHYAIDTGHVDERYYPTIEERRNRIHELMRNADRIDEEIGRIREEIRELEEREQMGHHDKYHGSGFSRERETNNGNLRIEGGARDKLTPKTREGFKLDMAGNYEWFIHTLKQEASRYQDLGWSNKKLEANLYKFWKKKLDEDYNIILLNSVFKDCLYHDILRDEMVRPHIN
jgi:hypothetical protein